MGQMTIWTSELVEQAKEKLRHNIPADLSCFHEKDLELKGGDILFRLTQEEVEEFHKCSRDVVYFVTKYCRFLTDKGRTTVDLRDFQEEILSELSEEEWKERIDQYGPKHRNYILMASRQTGKCLFNSSIEIELKNLSKIKTPINILYYLNKEHLTFLEKIKFKLMICYNKIDNW